MVLTKPRILLGDDHALILSGVRATLEPGFEVVGQATDGQQLVEAAEKLLPDVVVMDISMPVVNGFEAARRISRVVPTAKLIFLSQHLSPAYLRQALQIGVSGYVLKSETSDELAQAVRAALQGKIFTSPQFGPDILSTLQNRRGQLNREMADLTERQRAILQLLVDGRSNKEIAATLELSIKTIEFHRSKIMAKLGAHNPSELARIAMQQGIIPG